MKKNYRSKLEKNKKKNCLLTKLYSELKIIIYFIQKKFNSNTTNHLDCFRNLLQNYWNFQYYQIQNFF